MVLRINLTKKSQLKATLLFLAVFKTGFSHCLTLIRGTEKAVWLTMFVAQISLLDFRPSVSLSLGASAGRFQPLRQTFISDFSAFFPCVGSREAAASSAHMSRGAAARCVRDPGDTVMTRSKTEPSVPGSQEAMRLTSCDNL